MALQSSGSISILELAAEFGFQSGQGNFRNLSDYYAGDGLVASSLTDTSGNAVPSSGTIKLSDIYTCASFQAGSFTELSSGTTTSTVPSDANAVHIQFAVAGGGGGCGGADYDKAGGESPGAGGGSGAYISDKVFTVTAGETLTFTVGAGGTGVNIPTQKAAASGRAAVFAASLDQVATAGGTTSLSGSSTGSIFSLAGGGGASGINGDVAGPLRTNIAGTAGADTISGTVKSSGTFTNASNVGTNVTTLTSGPTGTFNDNGDGVAGANIGNVSGDNVRSIGSAGASSYDGNVGGGTGGASSGTLPSGHGANGSRGSGGGGGSAQIPASEQGNGGNGGACEIKFRYIRMNA